MTGTSANNRCGIFKSRKAYNLALQYDLELNSKKSYIHSGLYVSFDDVQFIVDDPTECVVNVAGQNLLLLHGNGSFTTQYEKSVNQIKGRYSGRGVQIDYIISGHIHSARIGDIASRSSSLVGANEYSEKGLNLSGRASQNIYIFHEDKNIDAMKIDLQYVGEECYNIDSELESYNAKSSNKLKPKKTIFEVTI